MAPRNRKTKEQSSASPLVEALKFISIAQVAESTQPYETHCQLEVGLIVGANGVLAAGQKIDYDMPVCPHTFRLLAALQRCGENFTLTQLGYSIAIQAEKFRAIIPCVQHDAMGMFKPDKPIAKIDDRLKAGFSAVSCIVADKSEYAVTASILLQGGSMASTNRHIMLEYWHGIDLPPGLVIPKAFASAIAKCNKALEAMGYSDHSVTFWFNDQSWIRTQRYKEAWPDYKKILNVPADPHPIGERFFHALDAVTPFSEDETIYFNENSIASHSTEGVGATYEADYLPPGLAFNPKYFKICEPFIEKIDWSSNPNMALFFGDNIRGAISGKR